MASKGRARILYLAQLGLLLAVVVVLQYIGNFIPVVAGINLTLIPIVVGAALLGPTGGLILGLACGERRIRLADFYGVKNVFVQFFVGGDARGNAHRGVVGVCWRIKYHFRVGVQNVQRRLDSVELFFLYRYGYLCGAIDGVYRLFPFLETHVAFRA